MPPRRASYVPDTEEPIYEVTPTDNVYSYFMFISPTEQKKEGRSFTHDIFMAYFLIFLNFFMQGVLIYTIFFEVVVENKTWQDGIVTASSAGGHNWHLYAAPPQAGQCNDGGSLCFMENGTYSCAPPSVQLTGRWDELDLNGDGTWTRSEVMSAREDLKCKYVVDPVEVFDVYINLLLKREHLIWLHPDVKAGLSIPRTYFTYAMGDVIMCGYRNKDMCPNLVKRGFFDAPMKHNTAPRVGNTVESALDYCIDLLSPGGTCERLLPSTYATWKVESVSQCGEPSYEAFQFTNPANGNTKSLLSVDYSAREDYERSFSTEFKIYQGIILSLWLLAMLVEFKEIIIIATWVARFPDAAEFGDDAVRSEVDPSDPEDIRYVIQGVTKQHRFGVGLLAFLRACLTGVLAWVGVSFLMKQTDYIDLLMDGVAIIFIAEIATLLYGQSLRPDIKDQTESLAPMHVRKYGIDYLNRRPALMDILCMFAIGGAVIAILYHQHHSIVVPVYESLECTCLSSGDTCLEATKFSKEFWDHYWLVDVPGVFEEVRKMSGMVAGGAAAAAFHAIPRVFHAAGATAPMDAEWEEGDDDRSGSLHTGDSDEDGQGLVTQPRFDDLPTEGTFTKPTMVLTTAAAKQHHRAPRLLNHGPEHRRQRHHGRHAKMLNAVGKHHGM